MNSKKINNLLLSINLILVGILTLIIIAFDLSAMLVRIFGIIEIVAIIILVYTSVNIIRNKK